MLLLWSELVRAALAAFWNSTVTTDPEYWLAWQPIAMEKMVMIPKSLMDSSVKVCVEETYNFRVDTFTNIML